MRRSLLFSILVFVALFWAVAATETGLQVIFNLAKHTLPGKLQAQKIQGKLLGGFDIQGLRYQHPRYTLTITRLNILWKPLPALINKIEINQVYIHELTITHYQQTKIKPFEISQAFFTVKGNWARLNFNDIDIKLLNGNLTGTVQLQRYFPHWQMDLTATKLDPSTYWPSQPGSINFNFITQGNLVDHKPVANLTLANLSGHLQDKPLSGAMQLVIAKKQFYFSNTLLKLADNELAINGGLKQNWDLNWHLTINDLKQLLPQGKGSLQSTGEVHGKALDPTVSTHLSAKELQYQAYQLIGLQLDVNGSSTQHQVEAILEGQDKKLILAINGEYRRQKQTWQGSLVRFDFLSSQYNDWLLDEPVTIIANKQQVIFAPFCLRSETRNLCLDFQWHRAQAWFVNLHSEKIDAEILKLFFPNLPKLGTHLTDLKLKIQGKTEQQFQINGSVKSATGSLTVAGIISPTKSTVKLQGENFELINNNDYHLYVSPDLQLNLIANRLQLTGTIAIPKGNINPHDFSGAVELPEDVVFVSQQSQRPAKPLQIFSDVTLTLGDKVTLELMGLTGELKGLLKIHDEPEKPTKAQGALTLQKGQYLAFGQKLKVDYGRLNFTGGPINNPGVAVKASRKVTTRSQFNLTSIGGAKRIPTLDNMPAVSLVNTVTVGLKISGRLKNPKVLLFSEPANLPQAEILSLLVLGRSLGQVGQADSSMLFSAISSLNLGSSQSGQLKQQLQHVFGLDQMSVETTTKIDPETEELIDTTSLVLGKALSSRLYVNYSVGLLQTSNNILRLRYLLGKKWIIQTETDGEANSVDVLYTFER